MSEPGRLVVHSSIWLAACLYFAAVCGRLCARRTAASPTYRLLWLLACAAYLIHAVAAFGICHGWSHARAVAHTAQRTYEITGWYWGGGTYVNYAFTALWALDATVLAACPARHARQPRWLSGLWLMATLFMFFQGMVVFGHGTSRALGIAGLSACYAAWLWHRRGTSRKEGHARLGCC
ncbi:MAG: hypothetical protein K6T86_13310 [Pirellulales bacterium]|nr:hypothetical protein [Pirellulales bacterium]